MKTRTPPRRRSMAQDAFELDYLRGYLGMSPSTPAHRVREVLTEELRRLRKGGPSDEEPTGVLNSGRPVVVEKRREFLGGSSSVTVYACGPLRSTPGEARADAELFARLADVRAALAAILAHAAPDDGLSDPEGGRWVGDSAILAVRRALGENDAERSRCFPPGEDPF